MNEETEKVILESLRMLLWENWRKYELLFVKHGSGCRSVESNEIEEQVKKINRLLKEDDSEDPIKDKMKGLMDKGYDASSKESEHGN